MTLCFALRLRNLVTEELEEWDGTVTGAGETEDQTETRQIRTGLRICLAFDPFANTVSCRVPDQVGKNFSGRWPEFCP